MLFDRGRLLGIDYGLVRVIAGSNVVDAATVFVKIPQNYHEYCKPFIAKIARLMVIVQLRSGLLAYWETLHMKSLRITVDRHGENDVLHFILKELKYLCQITQVRQKNVKEVQYPYGLVIPNFYFVHYLACHSQWWGIPGATVEENIELKLMIHSRWESNCLWSIGIHHPVSFSGQVAITNESATILAMLTVQILNVLLRDGCLRWKVTASCYAKLSCVLMMWVFIDKLEKNFSSSESLVREVGVLAMAVESTGSLSVGSVSRIYYIQVVDQLVEQKWRPTQAQLDVVMFISGSCSVGDISGKVSDFASGFATYKRELYNSMVDGSMGFVGNQLWQVVFWISQKCSTPTVTLPSNSTKCHATRVSNSMLKFAALKISLITMLHGLILYRLYSKGYLFLGRAWQVLSIIFTTYLHFSSTHDLQAASNRECMLKGVYADISTSIYEIVILGCNEIIAKTEPTSYDSIGHYQAVVSEDGGFVSLEIVSTSDSSSLIISEGEMNQADPYSYKKDFSLLWALYVRDHIHIFYCIGEEAVTAASWSPAHLPSLRTRMILRGGYCYKGTHVIRAPWV